MYIHSTRDLREAGFVWAQDHFKVSFKGLEASDKPELRGVFRFVFEIQATQEEVSLLLSEYMNQEATVEPKAYDQKLSNLRDNLRKAKSQ